MIKSTVIEIKNAFDELISRLDRAEERISELEDVSIESLKTEKQRKQKTGKKKSNIQGLWFNTCNGTTQGGERKRKKYLKQ